MPARTKTAGSVTAEKPVKCSLYLAAPLHRRILAGAREAGLTTVAEFLRHTAVVYLDRQADRPPRVLDVERVDREART